MTVVLIPWRPAPTRVAAFETVSEWYRENLPGADIRTVDSGDTPFNLARCRNIGMAGLHALDEPVVISDADTIPQRDALLEALEHARDGLVHLPYTEYRWLGPEGSAQAAHGVPLEGCGYTLVHGACSGVYVATPRTWESHGGQDELFRGWGYEDAAWYLAHATLLGAPPVRHDGLVFALDHEPAPRFGPQYEANAERMERYRAASGEADVMRELVAEYLELDELERAG